MVDWNNIIHIAIGGNSPILYNIRYQVIILGQITKYIN